VDDRLRQRLSRLGDGKGIDNWHSLPAHLGRSIGEEIVPVRAGMERPKEHRSAHEPALQTPGPRRRRTSCSTSLASDSPQDWTHWWNKTAL